MPSPTIIAPETLGLLFLLGMRHGLDPDHVTVIDNITFRAIEERPRAAAWTGFLFSTGHTVSVLIIAVLFGWFGTMVTLPHAFERTMTAIIAALFLLIGTLNLRALLIKDTYQPVGWRHGFLPRVMRGSTHPMVTATIGFIFGLFIDTAAQIAAWGVAASSSGGIYGSVLVGVSFAAGMILIDSFDSFAVTRLVSSSDATNRARDYRRRIGWLIVSLSYGMALYTFVELFQTPLQLNEQALLYLGIAISGIVLIVAGSAWVKRGKLARRSDHEG